MSLPATSERRSKSMPMITIECCCYCCQWSEQLSLNCCSAHNEKKSSQFQSERLTNGMMLQNHISKNRVFLDILFVLVLGSRPNWPSKSSEKGASKLTACGKHSKSVERRPHQHLRLQFHLGWKLLFYTKLNFWGLSAFKGKGACQWDHTHTHACVLPLLCDDVGCLVPTGWLVIE